MDLSLSALHQGFTRWLFDKRRDYSAAAAAADFSVVIIGAGFSGLGMAIKLKEYGIPFVVLEKAETVGGTWWHNKYPGCACDIPSHLYSFSFEPNASWSRVYPTQPELLEYLRATAQKYGIAAQTRFGWQMASADFQADRSQWRVTSTTGEVVWASVLISGMGALHEPNQPILPGAERFQGHTLHTAKWDTKWDATGKTVAIVGSAASAIQAIPELAKKAKHLYVFQRTPNWISPRVDGPYPVFFQRLLRLFRPLMLLLRWFYYYRQELLFFSIFSQTPVVPLETQRQALVTFMRQQLKGKEHLVKALTPSYPLGCKRLLISNDFYPAMARDNVTLVTDPIKELRAGGIVSASRTDPGVETEHAVDTIVYATGFKPMLGWAPVRGRSGAELCTEVWKSTPRAYLGMSVPDFPNFFILLGPGTGLGHNSVVWMIECQVNYVIQCLQTMLDERKRIMEVRQQAYDDYNRKLKSEMAQSVWASSNCKSWYQNDAGEVYALWKSYTWDYWAATLKPRLSDYQLQ